MTLHPYRKVQTLCLSAFVAICIACWADLASAQLYGRNVSRPLFDHATSARYANCRYCPPAWGFDAFASPGGPCATQYGGGACDACGGSENDIGCGPTNSCVDGFIAHRPNGFYGMAEFMPLTFDANRDLDFARIGPAGATVISTSHLDNEFDAGGRWTIGKVLTPCWRVEGGFTGNYAWGDRIGVRSADDLSSILSNFADPEVANLDLNNFALLETHTRFSSAELNFKYWVDVPPGPMDISLIAGFRYFNLDEQLHFRTESANAINDLNVNTFNDLYAVQIGIEGAFLVSPHWWIEASVKGGLAQNFAEHRSAYSIDNAAPTLRALNQDRTSFYGDVLVAANVQITPGLVLRAGYQATFINGVALAAENVETNNAMLLNGPTILRDSGEIAVHGPILGVMWNR